MRPVNLIPPEQRHGERRPARTGPMPYILLGLLVAVLVGVTALVLTTNQISERKDEVARLKSEDALASARAQKLASYTQFQGIREQRTSTIASLANSRFDWERVMRELSLVLPHDVWLTSLDAAAAGGEGSGEGGGGLSGSITGPSLAIQGCASGHEAVAGFITALKDIDGVTRVGVESSVASGAGGGPGESSGSGECGGDQFALVVAFDAAPIPPSTTGEEPASSPTEQAQTTSSTTSSSEGGG